MARLIGLEGLKEKLGGSKDAADAVAELTAFSALIATGTTITGGDPTIPVIVATAAKAVSALAKLSAVLIPRHKDELVTDPAERVDHIFYVLAQKAYLQSLEKALATLPLQAPFDRARHGKLGRDLTTAVVTPSEAEAHFQFGWSPESGNAIELYKSYTAYLHPILVSFGVEKQAASTMLSRLEQQARRALHRSLIAKTKDRQWLVNYQLLRDTSTILDVLQSFAVTKDHVLAAAWQIYLQGIADRPTQPIWGEEEQRISLSQLFVEPGYHYYHQTLVAAEPHVLSLSLAVLLSGLLSARRPSSELVFIMGGPGSGKTSLAEIFCANLAKTERVRIVLIPAKRLDPSKALLPEVQRDLRNFGHNSIADSLSASSDTILVIDGFDELAQATRNSLEAFFRNAHDLARERLASRLRIVLTGRPTLFQKNDVAIPLGSHVISVQPFSRSQVEAWSRKWRTAASGTFDGAVYLDSSSRDIKEIATQPMLLYLLARMHEDGQDIPVELGAGKGAARFQIYGRILDWVCKRQAGKGVTQDDAKTLRRFLQVAGLATHQSGTRVLHWEFLQQSLLDWGLTTRPDEQRAKAHSTILSFAFTNLDQQAWEFTHKSFGEALAAEAIGRILEDLAEPGRHGERWLITLPETVREWVTAFGPQVLSDEIMEFVSGWMGQEDAGALGRVIERLIEIFPHIVGGRLDGLASKVATTWNKPLVAILGNAIHGWFRIVNAIIGRIPLEDYELLGQMRDLAKKIGLDHELLRRGILLCHLAEPVKEGDFARLFSMFRRLRLLEAPSHSDRYIKQLQLLAEFFHEDNEPRLTESDEIAFISEAGFEEFLVLQDRGHVFVVGLNPLAPIEAAMKDLEGVMQGGFEASPLKELGEDIGSDSLLHMLSFRDDKLTKEQRSEAVRKARTWVRERLSALPSSDSGNVIASRAALLRTSQLRASLVRRVGRTQRFLFTKTAPGE